MGKPFTNDLEQRKRSSSNGHGRPPTSSSDYRLLIFSKSHQEHLQIIHSRGEEASPSMGDINLDVDIVMAKTYENGAAMISV